MSRKIDIRRLFILMTCIFSCAFCLKAQGISDNVCRLDFKANSSVVDTAYSENAASLRKLKSYLMFLTEDPSVTITQITITASASPEGSHEYNTKLSQRRIESIQQIIKSIDGVPDSVIVHNNIGISWDILRKLLENSNEEYRDTVVSIISRPEKLVPLYGNYTVDQRVYDLKNIDRGKTWYKLKKNYFPKMRSMFVINIRYHQHLDQVSEISQQSAFVQTEPEFDVVPPEGYGEVEKVELWQQKLHIKSNSIGWLMFVGNGAVELELSRHWSINLPVYYSAVNYFSREAKFKTLTIQPEVRYWFKDGKNWYAGAHMGIGWYNFALNGDYRIQDCGWDSPALGGGLSGGYRMDLTKGGRWKVEFTLGVGVYGAKYDKFRNEPGGLIVDTVNKTWFGIDQASVSFMYSIGLNKWTR